MPSGPQMELKSVPSGVVTADTASASFTATGHFETDFFFNEGTPRGVADYYYANPGSNAGPVDHEHAAVGNDRRGEHRIRKRDGGDQPEFLEAPNGDRILGTDPETGLARSIDYYRSLA